MKKIFIFLFLISFLSSLYASPEDDFDKIADFGITLKNISAVIGSKGSGFLKDRILILDGILSSFEVTDSTEAGYTAELTLINGEWDGPSEVYMYKSIAVFKGYEYSALFPAKKSRTKKNDPAELNSKVIVVCSFDTLRRDGKSGVIPVLKGHRIRFQ